MSPAFDVWSSVFIKRVIFIANESVHVLFQFIKDPCNKQRHQTLLHMSCVSKARYYQMRPSRIFALLPHFLDACPLASNAFFLENNNSIPRLFLGRINLVMRETPERERRDLSEIQKSTAGNYCRIRHGRSSYRKAGARSDRTVPLRSPGEIPKVDTVLSRNC